MIETNLLAKRLKKHSFEFREIDSDYAIANRIHKKPEWKKVVYPDGFDASTQKGIKPYYDSVNDVVMFKVKDMTQTEIDAKVDADEEKVAKTKVERYQTKGTNLIMRSKELISRRYDKPNGANNKLSKGDWNKLYRWFQNVWIPLSFGDFDQASKKVADILIDHLVELQTEPALKDTIEKFQSWIDDYNDNHYQK